MLETLNSCKEDLVNEMLITENDVKEATLNDIIDEIDNMFPYERDIYISLVRKRQEQNKEASKSR